MKIELAVCLWEACFLFGSYATTLNLSPAQVYVVENSSETLSCSKENGLLAETRWVNSKFENQLANLYISPNDGSCVSSNFLLQNPLFTGVCGEGVYSVKLNRIDRTQHGAKWQCKEYLTTSNEVVINVSVPASGVTLSQPSGDFMKENQTEKIKCNTSACRPDPRVQWYLRKSTGEVVKNLTQFSTGTYDSREYGLVTVESILNFTPNRTVNNMSLFCEVWTRSKDRADIVSGGVIVTVAYPPDNSPLIQGMETNDVLQVIESDTGTFVCSINGGNPLASLDWNCFGSKDITSKTQGERVFSTVKWTALSKFSTCSCSSHHILSNWKSTTNVTVNVLYPPTKPHFKIGQSGVFGDVHVIENNTLRIVCNSESNPLSNYTWTGPGFSGKGDTLEITSVNISNQGHFKCMASNRMTRTNGSYEDGSKSSSFNLTILYPPSNPKFKFENSSGQLIQSNIFYVVRDDTFSIYCDVKGNPVPDIKWDDNKSNPTLKISNINLDINSTCRAKNVMQETASQKEISSTSEASFSIVVFYPPGIPTIHVSNYNGDSVQVRNGNVSIIESETINATCFSPSKPMPAYKWTKEQSFKTLSTNVLKFVNVSRYESGPYLCNAENTMNRSIGKPVVGKNNSQLILNILYPAIIVNDIYDISIVEGSQLEIVCPVEHGNPSISIVTWSRQSGEEIWNNVLLFIKNVSRADDANYTCSVITDMFPTIGRSSRIERRKSFHLNVFFPSEIIKFTISTLSSGRTFVVNETQNTSFECIAEANPTSDLKIKSPRRDYIIEVSHSNVARYTLRNASFKDAGKYICTGRNNYTRQSASQSKLILIVRSKPRPSTGDTSVIKEATVMNVDKTLLFTAWDYLDKENKTTFRWFKENVTISDNDNKYMIHSNDLQTNITIKNTTHQDLGLYKVDVQNSVGMYTHFYELKATDKPEPPRDFRVMKDTITDASVVLSWRPGFNGGFQQTFVILYRMIHELVWLNKSIKENDDINMNYTLDELSSLQEYKIEMFAQNIEGNSLHTQRLHFKTKASIYKLEETKTTHSSNTGLLVGVGVSASVTTLVFVAVAIIGYRRFKNMRHSRHDSPKSGITVGVNATSNYTDLDTSRRDRNVYDEFNAPSTSTYERLNTSTREITTYMELKNTSVPNADTSDYVNIRI